MGRALHTTSRAEPTLAIFFAICSPLMAGMSGAVEACTCEGRPNAEDS